MPLVSQTPRLNFQMNSSCWADHLTIARVCKAIEAWETMQKSGGWKRARLGGDTSVSKITALLDTGHRVRC